MNRVDKFIVFFFEHYERYTGKIELMRGEYLSDCFPCFVPESSLKEFESELFSKMISLDIIPYKLPCWDWRERKAFSLGCTGLEVGGFLRCVEIAAHEEASVLGDDFRARFLENLRSEMHHYPTRWAEEINLVIQR